MFERWIPAELRSNDEVQSALVRLGIWAFGFGYIGLAKYQGYYHVDTTEFFILFGAFLIVALVTLAHSLRYPRFPGRIVVSLLLDIGAVSLAIYLTRSEISPFFLTYIWINMSYGTRHGAKYLKISTVASLVAYASVVTALDGWQGHPYEAVFFLILLLALPIYQFILLHKVEKARDEARAANQAKSNFLANMTHEIRTPLSGVLGMSTLLEGTPLNEEQQDYLKALKASSHTLNTLLGDILDVSKIEHNRLTLEERPYDLKHTLQEALRGLAESAHRKQLELVLDIDPELPERVVGDELRLCQILNNLVSNAIKFTEVGEIVVKAEHTAKATQRRLQLSIRDTGIGIPQSKLPHLFDSFWQADVSTTRRYGGTGLGTTIARDLAQRMGGEIHVESELGQGTLCQVTLPLRVAKPGKAAHLLPSPLPGLSLLALEENQAASDALLHACAELQVHCETLRDEGPLWSRLRHPEGRTDVVLVGDTPQGRDLQTLLDHLQELDFPLHRVILFTATGRLSACTLHPSLTCAGKPVARDNLAKVLHQVRASDAGPTPIETTGDEPQDRARHPDPTYRPKDSCREAHPLHILVVEDDEISAQVLFALLLKAGHQATVVHNGKEALEILRRGQFSLAFVDLRMPELDGIGFAHQLRQNEGWSEHLPLIALTANAPDEARAECIAAGMDDFLTKPLDEDRLLEILEGYIQRDDNE